MVEEAQAVAGREEKNRSLEEKFVKLKEVYQKLREEHITLLRQKAEVGEGGALVVVTNPQVDKRGTAAEIGREEAVRAREVLEGRVEGMLEQLAVLRVQAEEGEQEQKTQVHNLQASQGSLQARVQEQENTLRQREEAVATLERRLEEGQQEVARLRSEGQGAKENRDNVEREMVEVRARVADLEVTNRSQEGAMGELRQEVEERGRQVAAREQELEVLRGEQEQRSRREQEQGLEMVERSRSLEDIDSLTVSCYSLIDLARSG